MIEDGFIDKDLVDHRPGARRCARCRTTRRAARRSTSPTVGRCTAVELQWEFLRLAQKYADETGLEACGGDEIGGMVLDRWERTLTALERDPMELDGQLDWVTKLEPAPAPTSTATSSSWDDPKLVAARPPVPRRPPRPVAVRALVRAGKVERLVDEADVQAAMTDAARDHPGLFPGRLPRALGRLRGRRQLGQPDPRRRLGPVAADPDDGAAQGNEGARANRCSTKSATPAELVERLQG